MKMPVDFRHLKSKIHAKTLTGAEKYRKTFVAKTPADVKGAKSEVKVIGFNNACILCV